MRGGVVLEGQNIQDTAVKFNIDIHLMYYMQGTSQIPISIIFQNLHLIWEYLQALA